LDNVQNIYESIVCTKDCLDQLATSRNVCWRNMGTHNSWSNNFRLLGSCSPGYGGTDVKKICNNILNKQKKTFSTPTVLPN
jgi:hypothetical protein